MSSSSAQSLPPKPPNFSPIAPLYDSLARLVFGEALLQAQTHFLPRLANRPQILIIGGGSGEILVEILKRYPQAQILYLEAAEKMLTLTAKRLQAQFGAIPQTVELRLGTEACLLPAEQFDAVLTPFLLDLFPPAVLSQLMAHLDQQLKPQGLWLFTDFHLEPSGASLWKKGLVKLMYLFFGRVSQVQAKALPDFTRHFQHLGYEAEAEAFFYHGLIQSVAYHRRPNSTHP